MLKSGRGFFHWCVLINSQVQLSERPLRWEMFVKEKNKRAIQRTAFLEKSPEGFIRTTKNRFNIMAFPVLSFMTVAILENIFFDRIMTLSHERGI